MSNWTVESALTSFDETTSDCGETILPKPILEALMAFGYLRRERAGRHGFMYYMTESGSAMLERRAPEPAGREDVELMQLVNALIDQAYSDGAENMPCMSEQTQAARDALLRRLSRREGCVSYDVALNDAAWAFVDAMPDGSLTGNGWNNVKPALKVAIEKWLGTHVKAPSAPVAGSGE